MIEIELKVRSRSGATLLSAQQLRSVMGRCIGLIGRNGSGKSTLLKAISGLLENGLLTEGSVRVLGENTMRLEPSERVLLIGYIGADEKLEFPLSVAEYVALGLSAHRSSGYIDVNAALAELGIQNWSDRPMSELSDGERQLAMIARLRAMNPSVWLLDETLARLDLDRYRDVSAWLKSVSSRESKTIILVAHDLNSLTSWVDEIWALERGQVVAAGPARELLAGGLISRLYPQK